MGIIKMVNKTAIESLIFKEKIEANKKHKLFQTQHEAYAVLLEEVEELREDVVNMDIEMNRMWQSVRADEEITPELKAIKSLAIHAIQEAVQVAAMCDKAFDSFLL